jgi:prevent-host-death family protein
MRKTKAADLDRDNGNRRRRSIRALACSPENRYRTILRPRSLLMRPVRVSEDIVPVSDFKAQAADWLKRVASTGQPVVITQNGKAAGVLVSPAEFDRLSERVRLLEAIDAGLADEKAGRLVSHEAVVAEMKRRAAKRASKR